MERRVLAKCIKTYHDEDDMRDFEEGTKKLCEVKTYLKGHKYYVIEQYCDKDYFEIIKPRIYES